MRRLLYFTFIGLIGCVGAQQKADTLPLRALSGDTVNCRLDPHDVFVRLDTTQPNVYMIFSADSMFEGAPSALDVLEERNMTASFFFTGNFLRDTVNSGIIHRIVDGGHYVGPHSNTHLLLADWNRERTPLVSDDSLIADMRANLLELDKFGVTIDSIAYALPPFEWCSRNQAHTYRQMGLIPINPTPEIETYRDYTTPDMSYYWSSDQMLEQLFTYEATHNLNGAIIIIHLGTQDARTDKLYFHLPEILDTLTARGYTLKSLPK
ncbi:MAG: polysaccharide deacetylase family protein [Bacteroidales bacterium]|nr:polysaccharide deacetylase family protein [Bacteroidales bacterium]